MMNITPTVKQLLIINVIFYIGANFIGNRDMNYSLLSLYSFQNPNFHFWQPLTHMFMHAPIPNFSHILFNMFGLYSFGSALEHFWGGKKFLFFYISCGLGAALLHNLVNYYEMQSLLSEISNMNFSKSELQTLLSVDFESLFTKDGHFISGNIKTILDREHCTNEQFNLLVEASNNFNSTAVGASGAIYGLLTAFAFMFPNAELALLFVPIPIKAKYFVPGIIAIDLFLGLKGQSIFGAGSTGIAHFAHIGGALTGFIMMWFWKKTQFNKNRWN
jgi:membrane associated rhomboid family serine protease